VPTRKPRTAPASTASATCPRVDDNHVECGQPLANVRERPLGCCLPTWVTIGECPMHGIVPASPELISA